MIDNFAMDNKYIHYDFSYMPDSPVWYLERGKIREAKTILLEASRINKLIVPPDLENKLMKYARDL